MKIENKLPGKDVSAEDLQTKFPLVEKKIVTIRVNLKFLESSLGAI